MRSGGPIDTPGSPTAIKKGCLCPVEDNAGGDGFRPAWRENGGGSAIFWIDERCLLHAPKSAGEILEKLAQAPYTKAEVAARKRALRGPREVHRLNQELLAKDERS